MNPTSYNFAPKGPFDLLHQNQYFNGWPTLEKDPSTIVMAFPVEGWQSSAAVTLRQLEDGTLEIKVFDASDSERAKQQALAAMSLDEDGNDWPLVGNKDPFIGNLQQKYHMMRPTLFHSPYEAAAAFMIGHRISIVQTRKLRAQMAEELGEAIEFESETFWAFPGPQKLIELESFQGLNQVKLERLHVVAQAALDGLLDREYLSSIDEESALSKLETLPGVGPFFSQGILYRGVGIKDGLTHDDMTYHAIKTANNVTGDITNEQVLKIAEAWRPYRMWAIVLLHVWIRESGNLPERTFSKKR